MTKIFFLLPPSEGKNKWWEFSREKLSFIFEKPLDIAINATQKDLKCKWVRFEEGIYLNKNLTSWSFDLAINRYSWVMYNAIDYKWMNTTWKQFFEENFLILSWLYWILKPLDIIWNYKLPIETKLLYKFWWEKITDELNHLNPDFIVNLLPWSYTKMIDFKNIKSKIININFLHEKSGELKKITHWVKKVKGGWIKNICENDNIDYNKFWWEILEDWKIIDINIVN